MTEAATITLQRFDDVREAFRAKDLKQALYDEGGVIMADCLLTLHGAAHRDRRRLENRLFRREMFRYYEREVMAATIEETLAPFVAAGRADLLAVGHRTTMNLTADIAGIDRPEQSAEETEALYGFVKKFSEGATVVHSTRDRDEVRREVAEALASFDQLFLQPSLARRRKLLADGTADGAADDELPRDVLTTLLRNEDRLHLPDDVVRREVAFYLQAGSHSTANAFTHAMDELWAWGRDHPADLERARADRRFLQRCIHETLRRHPASPVAWRTAVAPVRLRTGVEIAEGALVVLDLASANREAEVFGQDAAQYNPHRKVLGGVAPWGHSFGGGVHACIGAELDGGLAWYDGDDDEHLFGTVAVMAAAVLDHGGRPDPDDPPQRDATSARDHFGSYPVLFDA